MSMSMMVVVAAVAESLMDSAVAVEEEQEEERMRSFNAPLTKFRWEWKRIASLLKFELVADGRDD